MIGISRWVKERREKRRAEMQTAIKLRKNQLEKKTAEILRRKEQAYQQLLEYCQKGDVTSQRAAAKRCIIFDKYIQQYKVGIEVLDQTLLVLETGELNSELKQTLSEIIKLTSIDIPNEKFIAAMQEFREKMEKILGAHEEIAEVLEPTVESAEVESYIARARAEVSVPKAKVKLEEKEENAA